MTNNREYFATAALAKAELLRQRMHRDDSTNSPFDYADDVCSRSAGIRSDVIGYWIEYR